MQYSLRKDSENKQSALCKRGNRRA